MKAWQTPKPNRRQTAALCIALVWACAACLFACWHWYQSTQDVAFLVDYARECTIYAEHQENVIYELKKRLGNDL